MAFKSSTATASPAATGAKPVGGRYAGIRPPQPQNALLSAGEYVLELIDSKSSRKASTAIVKAKVLQSEGEGATPADGKEYILMINFGGKAFDAGSARLVSLAMAVCGCETVEQLGQEEPNYDQLIDLICGARNHSEVYGDNPLAGRKVWARGWKSAALSKSGEAFVNWEFGIAAD
jgi:hypothetical protein